MPAMRVVATLALALVACAPTGELVSDEIEVLENEPSVAPLVHVEPTTALPWPGCTQEYPLGFRQIDAPWAWQITWNEDANHECRHGCKSTRASRTSAAPGIVVAIRDDGAVRVANSTWEVRLKLDGLAARHVQWTSWCGDEVAVAIHDGGTLRMVAIGIESGEIVDDVVMPIDDEVDPGFAMQMQCFDGRTEVHARGNAGAWRTTIPSHGIALRRVPTEVWAEIVKKPFGHELGEGEREEHTTRTRRFHRKGHELFALDRAGLPLWHRTTIDVSLGCLTPEQDWHLVGCSRCPTPMQGITVVGDHVFLEGHDLRSSVDVFDADGVHVVHISNN